MPHSLGNSEDPRFAKKPRRHGDTSAIFANSFPSFPSLPSTVPLVITLNCDTEDANPSPTKIRCNPYRLLCVPSESRVESPPEPYGPWMVVERNPRLIDKASLSEHPGKTKTTTKNTTTTRETYEISLGSTSFPISPSSIVRPGGSHANRQSKNEGMGVFLNPNKHSAVTMAADGNPALPSNSLALIPNPKNARRSFVELGNPTTPSSVNVIFRRPSSPSGLLSESHHALDSSPNAHHTDDWVDMVD
ncbi:hypothetical protein V6N13_098864 [Hibiscus sabdariffa]